MKKIIAIVGARPQFIKHFAFENEAGKMFDLKTIHTGQHYDDNMSKVFFDRLGMKRPDYMLSLGGGEHGTQTGRMMIEIENILQVEKPDAVVVYGDTNSTLAGALTAAKMHMPVAHIEAGLRSYNKEMPEEINRVLTDHVSEWLFVPGETAVQNLRKEGITHHVYNVGDIMKDLVMKSVSNKWLVKPADISLPYYYITIHRPYNTDESARLQYVLKSLQKLGKKAVFAIHPRTRNAMKNYGLSFSDYPNIQFIEPQGYFESLGWMYYSHGVITDSGGMQKEAYWMQKKCVTVRKETEWVETLENGSNTLVFEDLANLEDLLNQCSGSYYHSERYGDGNSASKIVKVLS
jgi:UDP-GlcNAc3NAcA epimerase